MAAIKDGKAVFYMADFFGAALPYIAMGMGVAIAAAWFGSNGKDSGKRK